MPVCCWILRSYCSYRVTEERANGGTLRTCVLRHPMLRWNSTAQVTVVQFVLSSLGHINYATTVVTSSRGVKREILCSKSPEVSYQAS